MRLMPICEDMMRENMFLRQELPDDLAWIREGDVSRASAYELAQVVDKNLILQNFHHLCFEKKVDIRKRKNIGVTIVKQKTDVVVLTWTSSPPIQPTNQLGQFRTW